ncbi:DUF551 domain-containing protein [Citrobacter sp. Cf097]|uniref:DUF551 domain-containing protein n=1 Tax=Citrobacter sp. Cf097 TaxID=2985059 RepID=UPI002574949F|nr:DUF551 domain-containing protein [Citrobacter sp. Cf097]EKH7704089.1 DUF551 domain-containing protein [Salmonella enterica]MDM3202555.1 DUF551 domain-containing protein [Citrobacter sp. Cf097]
MTALNKQALRYGDNVLWFLNELAAYDASDIDGGEFDVYGEDRNGLEGCSTIDVTELAADAAKLIEAAEKRIAELEALEVVLPSVQDVHPLGPQSAKMYDAGDQQMATKQVWDAMIAAAPQPQNSPQNIPEIIPGWIPVSERMPEVGVKVLCFPVEDEPIHASFNGQLWLQDISWSVSDESIDNVISCNVTHWMPLPASPKLEVK